MPQPEDETSNLRVDQWLWFARIAKSRTLAQALIERGKVRINRIRIDKPSQQVRPGDVITIALGPRVRVLQISALSTRRGPASEAARLYVELTPSAGATKSATVVVQSHSNASAAQQNIVPSDPGTAGLRPPGAGRPTKRERRATDRLKSGR